MTSGSRRQSLDRYFGNETIVHQKIGRTNWPRHAACRHDSIPNQLTSVGHSFSSHFHQQTPNTSCLLQIRIVWKNCSAQHWTYRKVQQKNSPKTANRHQIQFSDSCQTEIRGSLGSQGKIAAISLKLYCDGFADPAELMLLTKPVNEPYNSPHSSDGVEGLFVAGRNLVQKLSAASRPSCYAAILNAQQFCPE